MISCDRDNLLINNCKKEYRKLWLKTRDRSINSIEIVKDRCIETPDDDGQHYTLCRVVKYRQNCVLSGTVIYRSGQQNDITADIGGRVDLVKYLQPQWVEIEAGEMSYWKHSVVHRSTSSWYVYCSTAPVSLLHARHTLAHQSNAHKAAC